MVEINEQADFPESTVCPLCAYRDVFSWRAATEACIPLNDMQRGWCDTCNRWLTAQNAIVEHGVFSFEKSR